MVESQFHYGSITTYIFSLFTLTYAMSQFHYGSITTSSNFKSFNFTVAASQFHYGSITTPETINKTIAEKQVSIPLWFDYNQALMSLVRTEYKVSIPLWFDYNFYVRNYSGHSSDRLNSTMVRLQLQILLGIYEIYGMSQFHYGSITTK